MTQGEARICSRSRTAECAREAAVQEAVAALVNPVALEALSLFDASLSQWRASMGGLLGLDYPAVFRVADVLGIEVDAELLRYLQVLEEEQLRASQGQEPGGAEVVNDRTGLKRARAGRR